MLRHNSETRAVPERARDLRRGTESISRGDTLTNGPWELMLPHEMRGELFLNFQKAPKLRGFQIPHAEPVRLDRYQKQIQDKKHSRVLEGSLSHSAHSKAASTSTAKSLLLAVPFSSFPNPRQRRAITSGPPGSHSPCAQLF